MSSLRSTDGVVRVEFVLADGEFGLQLQILLDRARS
jgi:hypothetical protein